MFGFTAQDTLALKGHGFKCWEDTNLGIMVMQAEIGG